MQTAGIEVKRGKHLAFKIPDGKRFVRCDSLGADYTETAINERISGKQTVAFKQKILSATVPTKPNLLIDIQEKLQQANSPGFERWAKVYNLKEMAKTLIYLQENGLDNYDALTEAADASSKKYHEISDKTKANNERMKEIAELQKQIGTYGKTHEVYAQYCKLPQKKRNAFYNEHSSEIILCKVAKRYFDSAGLQKLPSINALKKEYAALNVENKKLYPEQKRKRVKMVELLTAKSNTDRILGVSKNVSQRRIEHEEG
jgi:acyl carrier protein phosphodiesterase